MKDTTQATASLFQVELFPGLPATTASKKSSPKKSKTPDHVSIEQIAEMVPDKTPEAFKTISEAAVILALPQYVLRFWESKFKQIKPLKMRGGRRYYRPEDIETLQTIKNLLYKEGYTIKGAKKAFEDMKKSRPKELSSIPKRKTAKRAAPLLQPSKPAVDHAALARQAEKKKELSNLREELKALKEQLMSV